MISEIMSSAEEAFKNLGISFASSMPDFNIDWPIDVGRVERGIYTSLDDFFRKDEKVATIEFCKMCHEFLGHADSPTFQPNHLINGQRSYKDREIIQRLYGLYQQVAPILVEVPDPRYSESTPIRKKMGVFLESLKYGDGIKTWDVRKSFESAFLLRRQFFRDVKEYLTHQQKKFE